MCLKWNEQDPLKQHLPDEEIKWPYSGFCLDVGPAGLTRGRHMLCVDQGYTDDESQGWCETFKWQLDGMLVFQADSKYFEVIPLLRLTINPMIILPEIQISFKLGPDGWSWFRSKLGPVNAMLHEVLIRRMDKGDDVYVDEAVNWLGNVISLCLGTFLAKISDPLTTYNIVEAKPAKVKTVNGKTVKVYRHATVGYAEVV